MRFCRPIILPAANFFLYFVSLVLFYLFFSLLKSYIVKLSYFFNCFLIFLFFSVKC